jgi:hypothetical protein
MGVQHDQVEPFNKAKASMLSPDKCESGYNLQAISKTCNKL